MITLLPGVYMVDVSFARPVVPDVLLQGLADMGWSAVALDQSSLPEDLLPFDLRFVGRLERAIVAQDTPLVRWNQIAPLPFDPLREVGDLRLKLYPFRLITGHTYAVHLMSRSKAQNGRAAVLETLAREGFEPELLSETRRNTRLPKRPNTSVSFWAAVARWTRPHSYVNSEDPFYFEDVVDVDQPEPQNVVSSAAP